MRWSQRSSYCTYEPEPALQRPHDPAVEFVDYDCVLPLGGVLIGLLVQATAYCLLAAYLGVVLPNEVSKEEVVVCAWPAGWVWGDAGERQECFQERTTPTPTRMARGGQTQLHQQLSVRFTAPTLLPTLHDPATLQVGARRPWWYPFSRAAWAPRLADAHSALERVMEQARRGGGVKALQRAMSPCICALMCGHTLP